MPTRDETPTNTADCQFGNDAGPLAKVVSVNTTDIGGGAERMAWLLFKSFQQRGLESWLVVGDKKTNDPHVMPFFLSPHVNYRKYGRGWYQSWLKWRKRIDTARGIDDYHFPYAKYLPSITGSLPNVVHCHNLHGGYFDLRVLAGVSRRLPVFITIQDCWSWTGHCAYPMDCQRWETGCGNCPRLWIPPAIKRDATRFNWRRKKSIYRRSRLYAAAPTRWIMDQAERSILAPAIVESRIIPNAVDMAIFRPAACRQANRQRLAISDDIFVIASCAHQAVSNPFKDYATARAAVARVAEQLPHRKILFLAIGEEGRDETIAGALVRHVPFQTPENLAAYFQAADAYIHAAKAEAFGMVIAEAMACGLPVVATDVGGIAEVFTDHEHGYLVPAGDDQAMAASLCRLIESPTLRQSLGQGGARYAGMNFDRENIVNQYLCWYQEVLDSRRRAANSRAA